MKRLVNQVFLEALLLWRYQVIWLSWGLGFLLALVLRYFVPEPERLFSLGLGVSAALASTVVFLVAGLTWIERQGGGLVGLVLTPLRPQEYLLSKGLLVMSLTTGLFGVAELAGLGLDRQSLLLLPGLWLTGWTLAYLGLALVWMRPNLNQFILPSLGLTALGQLSLTAALGQWPGWFWSLLPLYGAGRVTLAAPESTSLLCALGWAGLAYQLAHRACCRAWKAL